MLPCANECISLPHMFIKELQIIFTSSDPAARLITQDRQPCIRYACLANLPEDGFTLEALAGSDVQDLLDGGECQRIARGTFKRDMVLKHVFESAHFSMSSL